MKRRRWIESTGAFPTHPTERRQFVPLGGRGFAVRPVDCPELDPLELDPLELEPLELPELSPSLDDPELPDSLPEPDRLAGAGSAASGRLRV